jgi:peptidoglycan hydrolase CwlO-like protein
MTTNDNGRFVTKDRLIYILLAIIIGLSSYGVADKLTAIGRNTDDIRQLQVQLSQIQSDLIYIKEGIQEIRKAQKDGQP